MTTLSEKTRIALGLKADYMPARMAALQAIADNGPLRKCDLERIVGCANATSLLDWLLDQCWISKSYGSSHAILFTVTASGSFRLRAGTGEPTPPPTREWQPYTPSKDEQWGYVPPERLRAFAMPSAGTPT